MSAAFKLSAILCIALLSPAWAAKGKAAVEQGKIVTEDEVIYYPPGWKVAARDINLGIILYYNWTPQTNPTLTVKYDDMPAASLEWAAIRLNSSYLEDERGRLATVADHVAIKNCADLKCADQSSCSVHGSGRVPVNRLSKVCPGTVKEWPAYGSYCGRYFKRAKYSGTFFYYFDNYGPEPEEGKAQYGEITVIWAFKKKVYTAKMLAPADRIKNYIPQLDYVIKGMREKKKE